MRELIQPAQTVVPLAASVADMTRLFLEYPVKYLYVTDDAGRFRGAVALKDITSDLLEKCATAQNDRRALCAHAISAAHARHAARHRTQAVHALQGGSDAGDPE